MKRGEVWTASASSYAGKPRPVVIIQSNHFEETHSVTICALTTNSTEAPLFRVPVAPDDDNGLTTPSRLMVDKIVTIPRDKLGRRIGQLADADQVRLDRTILVFLGLAD